MTTETVQDVLREMRRESEHAGICGNHYADRIERALAGSEAVAEMIIDKYGCTLIGLQARGNLPDGKYSLYTTPCPALAKPQPVVDLSIFREAVECFADCNARNAEKSRQADELLALIDSAQDGKGE